MKLLYILLITTLQVVFLGVGQLDEIGEAEHREYELLKYNYNYWR